MAGRELLVREELLDLEGEREQSDRVGDVGPGDADPVGELLLLESELIQELAEGFAELDRVEVLAVDVLDEGFSEQVGVIGIPQDDGHGDQPRQLGGAEPPLPRDDLVALSRASHDDRLEDPDLADRSCQLVQGLVVESAPRLLRVRSDRPGGHLEESGVRLPRLGRAGDQRG